MLSAALFVYVRRTGVSTATQPLDDETRRAVKRQRWENRNRMVCSLFTVHIVYIRHTVHYTMPSVGRVYEILMRSEVCCTGTHVRASILPQNRTKSECDFLRRSFFVPKMNSIVPGTNGSLASMESLSSRLITASWQKNDIKCLYLCGKRKIARLQIDHFLSKAAVIHEMPKMWDKWTRSTLHIPNNLQKILLSAFLLSIDSVRLAVASARGNNCVGSTSHTRSLQKY